MTELPLTVPPGKMRISKDTKAALALHQELNGEESVTSESEENDESSFITSSEEEKEKIVESDAEKTLRIIAQREQEHKANQQASANTASSSTTSKPLILQKKETDERLFLFLLGEKRIREVLFYYLECRDLSRLALTCNALHQVLRRTYFPALKRNGLYRNESFEFFARGCWEIPERGVAFADRTSVAFHVMNESTKIKYSLFSGHHFIVLPVVYLVDLVKMCWTVYSILSRTLDASPVSAPHRAYHNVANAVNNAITSRQMIDEGIVNYLIGDRFAFSHDHTRPLVFDWVIPKRAQDLKYFEKHKAEIAMSVLCGETVNQLDSTTNRRLKLYDSQAATLRLQMFEKLLSIPMFQFSGKRGVQEYFSEWTFVTTNPPKQPTVTTSAHMPQKEPEHYPTLKEQQLVSVASPAPAANGSCVIC